MTFHETQLPLSEIRILDLTRLLPGPVGSLVLADLGATVDRVEDPYGSDYTRLSGPQVDGQGALFHALGRGKRSIVLDLKHAEGPEVLKKLVGGYDVVFEQFRPGVLERLGLGHEELLRRNPSLIVCALTGYGQTGPLKDRAGHDINYMARAGILGLQGPSEGPPQVPAFQLADVSGGLWSVIAILAALRRRDRTGQGGVLDIAMSDCVPLFALPALAPLLGGESPQRGKEFLTGGLALYNTYQTSDGEFMALGALEPKFFQRFCQKNSLEVDASLVLPGPHQEALRQKFQAVFASKTRAEWEAFAAENDCCLEPVLRPDELLTDPHCVARGLFMERAGVEGPVRGIRTPVTPREATPRPAPRAGEHTSTILSDAGFDDDEIDRLKRARIVV